MALLQGSVYNWKHREESPGRFRFALCDLYKSTGAVQIDVLPAQGKNLARSHPCTTYYQRNIAPGLRTFGYVLLPLGVGKHTIPLPFSLRQSDLRGTCQFAPWSETAAREKQALKKRAGKKISAEPLPKLTKTEQDLLWHLEHGYQLETDSLGRDLLLRKVGGEEVIRPSIGQHHHG